MSPSKRTSSDFLESDDTTSSAGSATPSPSKKVKNTSSGSFTPPKKQKASEEGGWTPEKREAFMTEVFVEGIKALGSANLAAKYGVSKSQMGHAIQAGRKGNFRDKAVKAVRGD